MASSEYLSGLGAPAKPGDKLTDVLTARRINALTEGTRALTRGDNLAQGPGILLKKSPVGVIISAAPQIRAGTPAPRLVALEIAVAADTAPTSAQIDAALIAFYASDTIPREGDSFRISRSDTHYPEVEVTLTATVLGPDWRFSPHAAITIAGKPWFKVTRDISGRVYFEDAGSRTTVGGDGLTILNKTGSKAVSIDPSSVTQNMTLRDLPILDGSEVKLARVLASEPVSQDPPVNLPAAQEYVAGGGIIFQDTETDAKAITVYAPELANPADQDGASLIKLEYIDVGDGEVRLYYSSRVTDNVAAKVRLYTEDGGESWYFDLDPATKAQLAKIAVIEASLAATDAWVEAIDESVAGLEDDMMAAQDDLITLIGRVDALEERTGLVEAEANLNTENIGILFDHVEFVGNATDELHTAISGATISCDSSGVTLTWGTSTPPPGP